MKTNHENLKSNVEFELLPEWFKNAKTKNANVEFKNNILVWEDGIWKNGIWKNGTWQYGTWEDGIWEDGIWKNGTWEDGIWEDGIWQDGTWQGGTWEDGTWEDGIWQCGTWECGTWEGGIWENGIWEDGIWKNGYKKIGFCKWKVYYSFDMIKIGCKIKNIENWDKFFASNEEYSTERNTQEFENIRKAYQLAKFALENKL